MTEPVWRNLVQMFFAQANRFGERPFLWRRRSGTYTTQTWRETAARVSALARGLKNKGLQPGDRVVIVSENRPAWLIADLAIMAAGGVTVPAYTTNTAKDHRYILENAEARAAIVSTARLALPLLQAAAEVPSVGFVVGVEPIGAGAESRPALYEWQKVIADGDGEHINVCAAADALMPDDLACIIYTSGTGGAPKGVMLPHRSILHNIAGAIDVLQELGLADEVFLSFLPLSHAYEHTVGQFLPIAIGAEIFYAESVDKVVNNMAEARPTIVSAVPRFYELVQHRIEQGVQKAPRLQKALFNLALRLGRKRWQRPGGLNLLERVIDDGLSRLVRQRVRERFGGRVKAMVAGGAPLNPATGLFFRALGLPLYQGYGQTEAGPLISVNRPSNPRVETVGPPLPGVEVRIADDGEILVRGPMVMLGYWRNEEATAETIRDGWLHTGDIGAIDNEGNLRISDRKKDIIVNSGGDNVSPARIEAMLTERPEIAQAMVFGDQRPHLVALIVPDDDWLRAWAKENGLDPALKALRDDPRLHEALSKAVDAANAQLSVIERVRRFIIAAEPFSIDNGQLTPTLKIRRHVIRGVYGAMLEALYR